MEIKEHRFRKFKEKYSPFNIEKGENSFYLHSLVSTSFSVENKDAYFSLQGFYD